MSANSILRHDNVGLLTVAAVEAPEVVTSAWIDEQLAETYERTGLNPGVRAEVGGIEERRWWPEDVTFDQAAAKAGPVPEAKAAPPTLRDRLLKLFGGLR